MSLSPRSGRSKMDKRNSSRSMKAANKPYRNGCPQCRSGDFSDIEPDDDFQKFATTRIHEFLEDDPRPTFVMDQSTDFEEGSLRPIYYNTKFGSYLYQIICTASTETSPPHSPKASSSEFRSWMAGIIQIETDDLGPVPNFTFYGYIWTAFRLRNCWAVFSGSPNVQEHKDIFTDRQSRNQSSDRAPPPDIPRDVSLSPSTSVAAVNKHIQTIPPTPANFVTPGTPDWTIAHPVGELSPHVIFARSIDWATTSLGDMSTWSREFRQVANLLMRNPHPAALFWGKDLTVMYNKAYADGVAGLKHPDLMGTGFRGPFAELWDFVSATFDDCVKTGKSVAMVDQMLPIERRGFVEETFFTWSITPLYEGTANILGLYNAPFETTRQVINDRRTRTLLNLGEQVALSKSVSGFWARVLTALTDNEFDFPFALLYSVVDEMEGDEESSISSESSHGMKSCVLEGTLGVPAGHAAAPARIDLKRSKGGFTQPFRDAIHTQEPKVLNINDGTLSRSLMEGFEWRGFGEPCKLAVVCPIRPTTGENVLGFLVIGVNPRRMYDDDYELFIRLLNRQLATSLASVTLYEDEIRRGNTFAHAAALERSRLSEELAISKSRLQRIAETSPVGMFSIDPEGLLLEANDRWFEMTGHPPNLAYNLSWMEFFADSSRNFMEEGWRRVAVDEMPWSGELQLKKPWYDPHTGEEITNWVLAAAQPEFNNGQIRSVMGSITDITLQKKSARDSETRAKLSEQLLLRTQEAEALQKQRLIEAEETRRQQNNFIDITSHEMRNPLSAIVQCADSISLSLTELLKSSYSDVDGSFAAALKAGIDSAETIQLCAQHQKSIVDDILTISKLDSNLVLITPVPVRPVKILQQALKMFMAELSSSDIELIPHIESSIEEMNIDWVLIDPSRLLQVLINLLTNAIKFTKSEKERRIDIFLSVSREPPANTNADFHYFPSNKAPADIADGEDWGTGEVIFLRFEVRDTGCGLNDEEQKNLFTRFSQASPRTHVQYGGSGLGLFISRQLTELQGGSIGVSSKAGVGSTFAFYLKARRAEPEDRASTVESQLVSDMDAKARIVAIDISTATSSRLASTGAANILTHPSPPVITPTTGGGPTSSQVNSTSTAKPSEWHVLIVEDNLVNQKILAAQITKLGCTTYVANHGGEALDMIRETKHYRGRELNGKDLSVILMDLEMPVMDGLTCVRTIRQWEAERLIQGRLPIIAVTANARGEQIVAAKDSGMDDVMTKPFRITQLIPKIAALLEKNTR